eukprot:1708471-Amphidinium_carterae.1
MAYEYWRTLSYMDYEVSHRSRASSTSSSTSTRTSIQRTTSSRAGLTLLLPSHLSTILVKPTYLDPTSVRTMTWSTGSINMFFIPKQQSHKRNLPT